MYNNYDYTKPGPSRQPYYNSEAHNFYDYPLRNSNNPGASAADRLRESHRGARQGFNLGNLNYQNNNLSYYPPNQWTATQQYSNNQKKQQQLQHSPQHQHKDKRRDFTSNRERDNKGNRSQQHAKKNKNPQGDEKNSATLLSKEIDYRLYKCPNCSLQFDFFSRYNSCTGRVPLILNCKHTVCQDCIYKLGKDCSVLCPVCKNPSVLPSKYSLDDIQDIFSPNYFLIGFIMWCKSQGNNPNFMSLVPVHSPLGKKSSNQVLSASTSQQSSGETCCFLACNKPATLHCQDCSDVYCVDCCTMVHKSAKSLWTHKQVSIDVCTKNTLELEKCPEHNMDLEFYCTTCETNACCYCCVEKHESHLRENLVKLSDEEMQQLLTNKDNAKKLLKRLLISQRRLRDLYSCSTSNIEKKISSYFVNYHAKLQFIEKSLKKELANYSAGDQTIEDIDALKMKLLTSIENLSSIVASCDAMEIKKLNLKELAQRLKTVQEVPCYLISEAGKGLEPLEFEIDMLANDLEDFFKIKKTDNSHFKLVTEDDLPSDYERDLVEHESDLESCMSSISKVVSEEGKQKKKHFPKYGIGNKVPLENEMVEVTHIESLECFYVQLKKTQYQFSLMNRDINDYIKMGAPTVDHPQLSELYLVIYQTKKEKIWCRGRITEVKNGEKEPLYEVFFIDYGSTQTVDVSKMRQITSHLTQKKPFAIHCELYNPSMTTWSKNAHVYMAKMLNGKQVTMLVKTVHSGVHEVDLMILSSDRGQTSIIDILIHTCNNALSNSSDNESVSSNQKFAYNPGYKIYGTSTVFQKFQQEKVMIVNIIDPHHIFVHIVTRDEPLKTLNNSLKAKYKFSQKNNCLPIEGTYVIVDYKDPIRGNWHRGLIKKVDFPSEKCHVLLVDWGLNVTVSWSSIRTIQEEFTRLESQAILVKLAHVEPIEKGAWLESSTTFLQKYYRTHAPMRMIVHNTDPLEVALFEIHGEVDICVNALLVEEDFAESTGKISQTVEWPKNEAEVKGFTEDDGLVATLLKQVESINEESDDDENKDLVKKNIQVVRFVSPDLIYVKFSSHEVQEMNLHKELQIQYSKERKNKPSWENDEVCVVLHNLSYARAKILEKISDKKYKVNIYDRAVDVVLPLEKIYEFNKYFSKFPNVVFKSHLANIRPAGGDKWSLSSVEALERMFDKYKDIYGTRVQGDTKDKCIPMHMWYAVVKVGGALEASVTKFVSLNNLLVKLGFAYKVAVSAPSSVKSNKSTSTVIDHPTDCDSISDLKEEIVDLKSCDSSNSELKDDASSVISSRPSEKGAASIDWNELIEEEEEDRKKRDKDEKDSPYRTQEAKISDWIPAFPIKEREFKAWITCAESGGILYLREEKLQNVYKEMEGNIKEYFDKKPNTDLKHNWEPGHLCTIHYNDYYYRGKVYKVNGPDDITVVMIDFGSDHSLTEKDLNREILYPKIPAFASKIKLDKVYAKSGTWMDSDYDTLLETVSEYSKIIIKGPLDVDIPLAEVYTDKGVNVNHTIIQLCPNLTRSPPTEDAGPDDEIIIEMDQAVKIEDEETLPPVDTTKFEYTVLHLPDKDLEQKIEVSIMFVLDYNKVALKETKTITDEFFLLGDQMQEASKDQPVIENLEVGMPCICQFSEDGGWYRAQIYNIDGKDDCGFVFVFFVDFGNVESVSVSEIKMMRPEWFQFPVSCHIAELNIEIVSYKNTQHVTQHMKKLYGKNKLAKIISKDPLRVSLYEPDGELSYESLVKKGLVELI